ncbi:uncharacterized protein LOC124144017 [Haliotis rufescens]|uniref:uncharacterized protein LOC124144017 n=1 Tax=Haliotis rufescens TaxID=6454 RepID=UPI001EB03E17|nr:uncharacterized protein LOC124144017 [Haliotis rufescens]
MPKPEHACVEEWASGDSNIQFEYPIASEVISVAVDNVGNQAVCLRDTSYGVRNTTVWVNAGCKGKVFICFHLSVARVARMVHDPAQTGILSNLPAMEIAPTEGNVSVVEQVTPAVDLMDVLTTPPPPTTPEPKCIDEWSSGYSRITFTLPHATSLTFLEVTNIEYDNTCTEGRDYGIIGSIVWVDLGCKAEFEICFSLS